jgi:hypothetical protein
MTLFHPFGRNPIGGLVFLALILIIFGLLAVWGWMQ